MTGSQLFLEVNSMSFICDLFGSYSPLSVDLSANKLRASKAEVEIRIRWWHCRFTLHIVQTGTLVLHFSRRLNKDFLIRELRSFALLRRE
jgi:hypothetical protein